MSKELAESIREACAKVQEERAEFRHGYDKHGDANAIRNTDLSPLYAEQKTVRDVVIEECAKALEGFVTGGPSPSDKVYWGRALAAQLRALAQPKAVPQATSIGNDDARLDYSDAHPVVETAPTGGLPEEPKRFAPTDIGVMQQLGPHELSGYGFVGMRDYDTLRTAAEALQAELGEARRLIKNLAPTGRYNGKDIEQWYQEAALLREQLAAADMVRCLAFADAMKEVKIWPIAICSGMTMSEAVSEGWLKEIRKEPHIPRLGQSFIVYGISDAGRSKYHSLLNAPAIQAAERGDKET